MCVLHVSSNSSSFRAFLGQTTLPVYQSHEKGDICSRGKRTAYEDYGFSCTVSAREWRDLAGQIEDAMRFLNTHGEQLGLLRQTHSIDDMRFDFPYECRLGPSVVTQCDYLPPDLLSLASQHSIGIELSMYHPS